LRRRCQLCRRFSIGGKEDIERRTVQDLAVEYAGGRAAQQHLMSVAAFKACADSLQRMFEIGGNRHPYSVSCPPAQRQQK
jgi:hypothetical protein